jgi:hypothetical protein
MKKTVSILLCFFLLFASIVEAGTDFVSIPYINNGKKLGSNYTLIAQGKTSKAVVIYLKGGDGLFRWQDVKRTQKSNVDWAVINLYKKDITVMAPDWPYDMRIQKGGSLMICGKRCSVESQERLLGIVEYAQKKYPGQPIWIVGHSNGATSIEVFTAYLKSINRLSELEGVIISGSRREVRMKLPELRLAILHHINDNCPYTTRDMAQFLFDIHKDYLGLGNNVSIDWIKGGYNNGKPFGNCDGGTHTYEGAVDEATDKFGTIILGDKQ